MKLLRKIFFPFVPVYFLVTKLRNKMYDWNVLRSKTYNFPIICVGNLSVGGTGKTPMIEYLIRLLKDEFRLATLSRGYKRKSSGFFIANNATNVDEIGDEPYQFKQKFNNVLVAVDEDRQSGIENLINLDNAPEIILLDDGFQHRRVTAGLNILLTTYNKLYVDDMVLPTGDLREPKSEAKRADIVVITKCPKNLNNADKAKVLAKLKLNENQKSFFSSIVYDNYVLGNNNKLSIESLKDKEFTLVTGIANAKPLVNYLRSKQLKFNHLEYNDHYNFTENDLIELKKNDLIITTEKDFVRLNKKLKTSNLFYLPIRTILDNEKDFETIIRQFVSCC